jgi:SAM-dependent methyltransferase
MGNLNEKQLEAFDVEYVNNKRWIPIKQCIDRDFPDGQFSFVDLGGGNGIFADRILAAYPKSTGLVIDNSSFLLGKNLFNDRKRTVLESVENISHILSEKYDIIFFNWLLHHLIDNSYARSLEKINSVLDSAKGMLTERGRVSIYENMYKGFIIDNAPSVIIYHLTIAKAIAPLIRRGGANTAGVGVCFLSYKKWYSTIKQIGYDILDYTNDDIWSINWKWHTFLLIKNIRCGHFWLTTH